MTLRERLNQVMGEGKALLLDGAMGTVIMQHGLTEDDFRGKEFAQWPVQLKGNNDLLVLTRPDIISGIHRAYLEAGADLISTCTFSSQRISQQEYQLSDYAERLCRTGVRLARAEADRMTQLTPEQPRYVLGDIGPTSRMLSMSEDVNDPGSRSIMFDELSAAFEEQMRWLVEEGVDALLVETIFDTLNAKAAIAAYETIGRPVPLMLSMTVSDASGRTLSGQTIEAFCISVAHARPLSIGMNCGLGPDGMLPYMQQMRRCVPADTLISCHPNAGLPNQMGEYDVTPKDMVAQMRPMLEQGLVNIIGGCCGTTPEHIAAMRQLIDDAERFPQNQPFESSKALSLSGLNSYYYNKEDFIVVGERCNVAGSRKFLRLISERKYDEALDIARRQVKCGAMVIDINMDDGLLDARQEMRTFLNLLASDPAIARVPVMVDSSRFDVIEEGLKCCQGKAIVNSISLKQGEKEFLRQARVVRSLGAAVIVMCFDEEGQATDYERRIQICRRAYRLLTEEVGFPPTDIIFDPNILTIATGMVEHANYALDFIRATEWIATNLPGTRVSGGLSNLSFAFRGNNPLREAMHAVFLHLARKAGMGMAIMNPATAVKYEDVEPELRDVLTAVILNTDVHAAERLTEMASMLLEQTKKDTPAKNESTPQVVSSPTDCIKEALLKGTDKDLEANLNALLAEGLTPLQIISGPLMQGMNEVGRLFGEGKMFLPQVVKTARTMKRAVDILLPASQTLPSSVSQGKRGVILLATVKGDVHDIGKNIVGVVMGCNGFEVIDLGVMVPCDVIVREAIARKADIVCLSGLITPSLDEMCHVAEAMQKAGLSVPLFVGGATTSPIHTAVKIAPLYRGGVFHMRDAAQDPVTAMQLLDPVQRETVLEANRTEQLHLRQQHEERQQPVHKTTQRSTVATHIPTTPPFLGHCLPISIPIATLLPLIDWRYLYWAWKVKDCSNEACELRADAETILAELSRDERNNVRILWAFYPAKGTGDAIIFNVRSATSPHIAACTCPCCTSVSTEEAVSIMTPRQLHAPYRSLCDYVAPHADHVGVFATTMGEGFVEELEKLKQTHSDDYRQFLLQTLGDRLVEAAAEHLSRKLLTEYNWSGIRPAVGYPSLPDQRAIFQLARLIDFSAIGIRLTENGAMYPQSSVCGLLIGHPDAEYFSVKNES